ncbi:MAG: response regulator transcription factor [Jatrophihabitans sp.]|uniref:response regulator transcription factor n=1 Tax=Jatrophihabitans sp. TaxID=1932789 RepID=UPI003F81151E
MARILVVDDEQDIRELVTFKLARMGHDVTSESDGEAGLAAARRLSPELVLVDWMMPRLTGIEVCSALRQDPDFVTTPIILLTARAQEADLQRGFAAGATDYVVKPFSPRELAARVDAALLTAVDAART